QQKAPPLELGSETCDGVTIATARYMPPKDGYKPGEPIHQRHNYSPSAFQVGDRFVISSSVSLARDLVAALKPPTSQGDSTLIAEAEGAELARLLDQNRERLVSQNMLTKGNDRPKAEQEVALLPKLVRYLGRGSLSARDTDQGVRLHVDFALGNP